MWPSYSAENLTAAPEGSEVPGSKDHTVAEAERDVRELEQYVADQHVRIKELSAAGREDDELKAREGLFLLADALEIARRRLRAERSARGTQ
jgi:hypothetical protein